MSEMQLFSTMTFPEIYERVLVGPLFRPFAQEVIARLEPTRSDNLIDIACGTGIVARLARETLGPESRIVGVDVAPAMLAVARSVDPAIDWREGTAMSLPVKDRENFSMLTCHQGLQFFPDRATAIGEMRRVLAPGGRVAIATWRSLQDIPVALALNDVAERHVGTIVDSRHSFGNADTLKALLVDGGFRVSGRFHLRPYQPSDEDATIALWQRTWQLAYPAIDFAQRVGWWRERWCNELVPKAEIIVAEQAGEIAGFVTIDATGYLDQLVVAPDQWGSRLADTLVDEAKRRSPDHVTLKVNADNARAIRFYERNGFVHAGEDVNPSSGRPVLKMQWKPE